MKQLKHSRRGFVEILLILLIIILILAVAGGNSARSGSSTSVQTQQSVQAQRNARRQAVVNRLEALRARRVEVANMNDYAVKQRMLAALDKEIAALETTLREEY